MIATVSAMMLAQWRLAMHRTVSDDTGPAEAPALPTKMLTQVVDVAARAVASGRETIDVDGQALAMLLIEGLPHAVGVRLQVLASLLETVRGVLAQAVEEGLEAVDVRVEPATLKAAGLLVLNARRAGAKLVN